MIKADDGAVWPISETDSAEGGPAGMSPTRTYTTRYLAHALVADLRRAPGTRIGTSMKSRRLCVGEGHRVCR